MKIVLHNMVSDWGHDLSILKGCAMHDVINNDDELIFQLEDGTSYKLYHKQQCCENVRIESIVGDLSDLRGEPLAMAEEVNSEPEEEIEGYHTWTFYKFATIKGYVTVRFLGQSNGYYSESVQFVRCKNWRPPQSELLDQLDFMADKYEYAGNEEKAQQLRDLRQEYIEQGKTLETLSAAQEGM